MFQKKVDTKKRKKREKDDEQKEFKEKEKGILKSKFQQKAIKCIK